MYVYTFASSEDKPIHYAGKRARARARARSLGLKYEKLSAAAVTADGFSKRNVIGRRRQDRISMAAIYNGAIFSAVSALSDAENHTRRPNRLCHRLALCLPLPWLPIWRGQHRVLSSRRRRTINLYAARLSSPGEKHSDADALPAQRAAADAAAAATLASLTLHVLDSASSNSNLTA